MHSFVFLSFPGLHFKNLKETGDVLVSYAEFTAVYGSDALTLTAFNRFEFDAEVILDDWTTGIDGVRKLRVAFPTNPIDVAAIKRCAIELTKVSADLDHIDTLAASGDGGIVASKSSGSESISYRDGASALVAAAKDASNREAYVGMIVRRYLSGRSDANGVNLLYGGAYPVRGVIV